MASQMHNIYITEEQKQWLKDNREFNLSGFVRKELTKEINKRKVMYHE